MKYSREETEIKKEILFRMYERGFEYKDMADIVGNSGKEEFEIGGLEWRMIV